MQQSVLRTILITGANKGIGYVTVARLFSESIPYDIILTSRDEKLGEKAVETLQNKYPNSTSTLMYHQLDVNDEKSVENLVAWIKNNNKKIDVLINNAGVVPRDSTDEQKKLTVKTNFLSVVNLTEKLIPFLSDDGKVIQVSSRVGSLARQGETLRNALADPGLTESKLHDIAGKFIELTQDFKPYSIVTEPSYPASKALLNAYIKNFLPSKVKTTQQIYAVHPGWVKSDLGGPDAPGSLEEGADTIVYLTGLPFKVDPELNAKLIGDRKDSQRKTILITGANKGIGFVTVARLLSESTAYDIILTSRDTKLGEKAIETLQSKYVNSTSTLVYHQLDVNDDKSVDNLVDWVKTLDKKIDVLINNAGVVFHGSNDEQKKLTVKTNFFSVVRLTEKFIPLLADNGKILQVSSRVGQLALQGETLRNALSDAKLTEPNLYEIANHIIELTQDFKPFLVVDEPSYPASKALLNAYVRYFLPSKLKPTQEVYAVHPGWVRSDLGGESAPGALEEGADTIVY